MSEKSSRSPSARPPDAHMYRTHKLFRYFERMKSEWVGSAMIVLIVLFVRLCVSVGPYSGQGKAPMYGDFEAQRHWMEITNNIEIKDWYRNTTNNNLQYWGLDYPPLTAYHSWFCGKIASIIYPEMIELNKSHGIETEETKFFMRMSVILFDLITFIPACFIFFNVAYPRPKYEWSVQKAAALTILLSPLYVIIDNGHFQYNCVALGLALYSIELLFLDYNYIGAILFVLAIGFKQMSLWYSIPFFCYCVGKSFAVITETEGKKKLKLNRNNNNNNNKLGKQKNSNKFLFDNLDEIDFEHNYKFVFSGKGCLKIIIYAIVVIGTFIILFLPLIYVDGSINYDYFISVIKRIFPFNRGLFEDKVSNIWCATNIAIKWRERFGNENMKIVSLIATLLSCLPSGIMVILKPKPKHFIYSLAACSMGFYLFSFQVHEKNIMFAMLPYSLLILEAPYMVGSLTWIATFSMLPLLVKDNLLYYYWILQCVFYFITSCIQPITTMYRSVKPPVHPLLLQLTMNNHDDDRGNNNNHNNNNNYYYKNLRRNNNESPAYGKTPFNTPAQSTSSSQSDLKKLVSSKARQNDEMNDEYSDTMSEMSDSHFDDNLENANEKDVTFMESKNWKEYIDSKIINNDKNEKANSKNKNKNKSENNSENNENSKSNIREELKKSAFLAMHAKNQQNSMIERAGQSGSYGSSASEGFTYGVFQHAPPLEKYSLYWSYAPLISLLVHVASNVQFSEKYPHIGVYMIVIFSCANFVFAWLLITAQHFLEFKGKFNDTAVLLGNELASKMFANANVNVTTKSSKKNQMKKKNK